MNKQYTTLKINEIKPYLNNPRVNDKAVKYVQESINQCGYIAPIIVDEDYVVLAGHTRFKALKMLGYNAVDVVIVNGLTEQDKRKYRLLDNKTAELSEWDFDLLSDELAGLDFGDLDFDWDNMGKESVDAIDLEEAQDSNNNDEEQRNVKVMHCPKCGFVFEVAQ